MMKVALTLAAALLTGSNVLAVEIHQNATNSSDISFNFELTGAALNASVAANQLQLTWPAWAASLTLHSATNLTPPVLWLSETATPTLQNGEWTLPLPIATTGQRFYRLQAP